MIRFVLIAVFVLAANPLFAAKYVFARGADNALWYYDGSRWQSLGGSIASAPDATSWGGGRIDVFARGSDNALWQISRVGGTWTQWYNLGGTITSAPSAASWGPNRIDVVALGTDGALWHKAWACTRWTDWSSLGGSFPPGTSPDIASWGPNRLDVFARGSDEMLWQIAWDGSGWSDWNRLSETRITSDPGAVSWGPNRIDAFARGADGKIWQIAWDGTEWTRWFDQGGQFPPASGPDATASAENRLEIYARGTDNAVWERDWDGTQWSAWKSLGGNVTSDPSAVVVREAATPARYRISINGFTVGRESWDDILERDGKRDEVFLVHQARMVDRNGNVLATSEPVRSSVMGDINRDDWRTSRVQAGSASPLGGLRTNDTYPNATPWVRSAASITVWEGELAEGQSVVAIPTIWEWDGDPDFLNRALGFLGSPFVLAGEGLGIVLSPPQNIVEQGNALALHIARRLTGRGEIGTNVTASKNVFGDPKDRPIGMKDTGINYVFEPQALVFTLETAEQASRTDFGRGNGVLSVRYRDAEELKGDYTLYVQVERR